ncbi:MAG: C40 family peptidase [Eggerthellaceae bacterium]|nr:C40 family peptidase [Eggerthellaceae bacterium]
MSDGEKTEEQAVVQQQVVQAGLAATYAQTGDAGATVAEDAGQAVAISDITSFDESTGTATLSDGTTATVVGYDANTGNAIVDLAASFVGGNYQWGAEDPTTSTFDCSGLVQYVYAQNGITVGGHNDLAILNAGTVVDSSEAQAGDILWWNGHVAIYAGDNMMISADNEQYGITYREISPGATYVRY